MMRFQRIALSLMNLCPCHHLRQNSFITHFDYLFPHLVFQSKILTAKSYQSFRCDTCTHIQYSVGLFRWVVSIGGGRKMKSYGTQPPSKQISHEYQHTSQSLHGYMSFGWKIFVPGTVLPFIRSSDVMRQRIHNTKKKEKRNTCTPINT